jgi:para-nitrobenzyl esterase
VDPEQYEERIRSSFGEFADRILELYPGETEEETYTSSADLLREMAFAWPSWAWARLQKETGNSNIYMYYFDQQQPASPWAPVKPRGAHHGAEMVYAFGNMDTVNTSEEDLKLSEIMSSYWTNFARTGDPNGEGLPEWPGFNEEGTGVLYLHWEPEVGPIPNPEKLELMEEYFAWRRSK